ncbi:MAG TPA: ABC-2 family transporter protein [Phycisphaerae bacterium]|nr:ABC-2 family transporter protein [Phycisphaerae bacterium]
MMLKKMRTLVSAQYALMLAYRAEIYLWVIAMILPFIMMAIWATASEKMGGANFAMSSVDYVRYFFAVWTVRQFTVVWMIYDFEYQVNEGKLSPLLLRPIHAVWNFVAGHLGEQMARVPFAIIIGIVFFLLYPKAFWIPSLASIPVAIIVIYFAFALRFAMQFCLACGTFWFERASAIDQLTMIPYFFLSGFVIPLKDMPPAVATFARCTPFPYVVEFPARLLTGDLPLNSLELPAGLAIMSAWFLAFLALGSFLWKRGLLQYSGHGA